MSLPTKVDFIKDRFDPFTEIYSPNNISDEQHTIPSSSPFYIRAKEVIKEDSPSSIEIWTGAGKTGDQYTEVSSAPGPGEFQVDYKFQSGWIRFNEANGNTGIYITYKGLGDVIQAAHMNTVQNVLNLDNIPTTIANLLTDHNANTHPVSVIKLSTGSYSENLGSQTTGTPFVTNKYAHQVEFKGSDATSIGVGRWGGESVCLRYAPGTSWQAYKYVMSNTTGTKTAYAQWSYHTASEQGIWGIWDKDQKKLVCVLVEEDEGYCKLFPELKPNQILIKFKDPNNFLKDEYNSDIDKVKDQANKDKKRKEKGRAGYILEDVEVKIEDLNEIPK